jgi:hypothetical protein
MLGREILTEKREEEMKMTREREREREKRSFVGLEDEMRIQKYITFWLTFNA